MRTRAGAPFPPSTTSKVVDRHSVIVSNIGDKYVACFESARRVRCWDARWNDRHPIQIGIDSNRSAMCIHDECCVSHHRDPRQPVYRVDEPISCGGCVCGSVRSEHSRHHERQYDWTYACKHCQPLLLSQVHPPV